jgi:hypothetical protein
MHRSVAQCTQATPRPTAIAAMYSLHLFVVVVVVVERETPHTHTQTQSIIPPSISNDNVVGFDAVVVNVCSYGLTFSYPTTTFSKNLHNNNKMTLLNYKVECHN